MKTISRWRTALLTIACLLAVELYILLTGIEPGIAIMGHNIRWVINMGTPVSDYGLMSNAEATTVILEEWGVVALWVVAVHTPLVMLCYRFSRSVVADALARKAWRETMLATRGPRNSIS